MNQTYNRYKETQADEQLNFVHNTIGTILRKADEFKKRQKDLRKEFKKKLKTKQKKAEVRKSNMQRIRQKARKKNSNYEERFKKTQQNLVLFKQLQKQEMMLK